MSGTSCGTVPGRKNTEPYRQSTTKVPFCDNQDADIVVIVYDTTQTAN